ncbi:calcium-activated chloride channel-domain-containing protein [Gamsiella multidivaricata]|uniref:calcium-activated chloride channel-domain-containing protein n=1 Tax=Gamsiella multidivaricata TaxID=101098 RepID=UPI00221F0BD5|nr:calcium-activated chloride channel-domain-containing protein [Gamsiella multidivaricata]KAI7816256.1 calcium-activated chloride channel-domain-containing protein [Gamsiella multidivaricata]
MSSYRVVHLLYQADVDLFDAIQDWKDNRPNLWVDDAIDAFASAKGADALAQLVYSTEAFDITLKYDATQEELAQLFDRSAYFFRSPRGSPVPPSQSQQQKKARNHWMDQVDIGHSAEATAGDLLLPFPVTTETASAIDPMKSGPSTIQKRHFSRLEKLKQSPGKLLSRASSLESSTRSSSMLGTDSNLDQSRPRSMSHISLPMTVLAGEKDVQGQSFQPLRPLECSTDMSPSPQSSTAIVESEDRLSDTGMDNQTRAINSQRTSGLFQNTSSTPQQRYSTESQGQGRDRPPKTRRNERASRAKLRQRKIQLHRRDFQTALLKEGVFLELEKSVSSDAVYIKVLAPFWRLAIEAQKTNCKADLARYDEDRVSKQPGRPKDGTSVSFETRHLSKIVRVTRWLVQKAFKSTNDLNYRAQLHIKWARQFWRSQPLDLVNTYFGERIGIYFAWLGHYTKWLVVPAAVGIAVFVFGVVNAARLKKLDATPNALFAIFDNALTMPFALFMSIWSTVYIEFWKRANQYYSFQWNMNDYERIELPRTEFRATKVRISPVTGKLTAIFNLIVIIILGEIWCRLAEWLTDKENHKYTDAYEDSLITKRYLFDFTNMYATLFYYAFFKAPFGGGVFRDRPDLQDKCLYDACITELTVQLSVVFIGKQFLNGLFEMVFP